MKKKIGFLILGLSFIFCGCTANYNIEITDDTVIEDFSFYEDLSKINNTISNNTELEGTEFTSDNKTYKKLVDEEFNIKTQAFINEGSKYYKKKIITSSKYGISYTYKYDFAGYKKSYIANTASKMFNFLKDNNTFIISTSSSIAGDYFENFRNLDSITVHLKSYYEAKKNNADRIDGYNYYWDINRSNYKDKKIYIELDKNSKIFNYENSLVKGILIFISIAILIFIVIIFFRKKSKRTNKI